MTTEQIAALVGAAVLCLGNLAAWFKTASDVAKQKADRLITKSARDQDSADLHDAVMKNTWDIATLKESSSHRDTLIEDLQKQINALNTTLASTNVKLDTLTEAIKELRK